MTYNLVMRGLEAGDTDEKILEAARRDEAMLAKYGDATDDETQRIIDKGRPNHAHVSRSCSRAACTAKALTKPAAAVTPVDWEQLWADLNETVEYVLDPFLPLGRTTTVASPPKLGKSLFGLEIAATVATGRHMWGKDVTQRQVLYLDQEMSQADLRERLRDMGFTPNDDFSALRYYLHEPWPYLDTPQGGAMLLDAVKEAAAELVVIDTQSKVVEGDENDAGTMTRFFKHTLGPLKALGVTVLLFNHLGRDASRGARGSSQKSADVDAVWTMTSRGENKLTLTRTHNRTRHGEDVLYLDRCLEPLRHELIGADDRLEEVIKAMIRKMTNMDLDPTLSANAALALAHKEGLTGRGATQREAYKPVPGWLLVRPSLLDDGRGSMRPDRVPVRPTGGRGRVPCVPGSKGACVPDCVPP